MTSNNKQTLEQQRASLAYKHVLLAKDQGYRDEYKTMMTKAPTMIRTMGLLQTLYFYLGKAGTKANMAGHLNNQAVLKDASSVVLQQFLQQAALLDTKGQYSKDIATFVNHLTNCATSDYILMARHLSLSLIWYRRYCQIELAGK